uniref:PSP proline-rich domain-containing protein n=1 Tax=Peronospora matthiolae TaxID=2874970 RepID=A0AAV1VIP5_9STRA
MATESGLTKNQRRRLKKRAQKQAEANGVQLAAGSQPMTATPKRTDVASPVDVEVEYVSADPSKELALVQDDPVYEEMLRVLSKFSSAEELCGTTDNEDGHDDEKSRVEKGVDSDVVKDGEGEEEREEDEQVLSRKARKKSKRLSVAELKQLVSYPDVVEAHDVTSADPRLLVYLKSYRNTVPVPHHWCHKRKYLQGKRGIEKPPFQLPEFIAQTGIAAVRDSVAEDDEKKRNKQRARERVQPKMGRVDIDYQVLHDAFFRFQTKPKLLTRLGDLYYEGKEFEVKLKTKVPGQLSDELKAALGMVEGVPPPWLLNVQRYGPPPAYPNLKIPGLNAPIPEGSSFGYHPGGWGKPPVDENGVPLYGDVFGKATETETQSEEINRERWGELEEEEGEEEEDGEGEGGEEEDVVDGVTGVEGLDATGVETPLVDGISSVASGLTTPGVVDLRKGIRGTETPDTPQQLYTVLEQKDTSVGTSLYGSAHAYVLPSAAEESSGTRSETGRVRRRFEDTSALAPADPAGDEDEAASKKKKAKTEKSKKLKDFKF